MGSISKSVAACVVMSLFAFEPAVANKPTSASASANNSVQTKSPCPGNKIDPLFIFINMPPWPLNLSDDFDDWLAGCRVQATKKGKPVPGAKVRIDSRFWPTNSGTSKKLKLTKKQEAAIVEILNSDRNNPPANTRGIEFKVQLTNSKKVDDVRVQCAIHTGLDWGGQKAKVGEYCCNCWVGDGKGFCVSIFLDDPANVAALCERECKREGGGGANAAFSHPGRCGIGPRDHCP